MKKAVCTLLIAGIASLAIADIQEPPSAKYGPVRKLSRAFANLVYGISELPSTWYRTNDLEGRKAGGSYGVIKGTQRTISRVGYGLYELFTFPAPTYKQGYRPPYFKKADKYPWLGYQEFPPQLGFITEADYTRTQRY